MKFVTETPTAAELQMFGARHLIQNEFTRWTIDKACRVFLILKQEVFRPNGQHEREDFYFHYNGQNVVVSFMLNLETEGDVLVFRWKIVSSYNLAQKLMIDPSILCVNKRGLSTGETLPLCEDDGDYLSVLKQAFVAYKTNEGFIESPTQKMIIDDSAVR